MKKITQKSNKKIGYIQNLYHKIPLKVLVGLIVEKSQLYENIF